MIIMRGVEAAALAAAARKNIKKIQKKVMWTHITVQNQLYMKLALTLTSNSVSQD